MATFWDLGGDLAKTRENQKNDDGSSLLRGFWGSWGVLLEAMLAHLGAMLGYVGLGDKMRPKSAKISQDGAQERQDEAR